MSIASRVVIPGTLDKDPVEWKRADSGIGFVNPQDAPTSIPQTLDINYLILGIPECEPAVIGNVSPSVRVGVFIDQIHEKNKLECAAPRLRAYRVDIPVSLGSEWTDERLDRMCTESSLMRITDVAGTYFAKGPLDKDKIQVLVRLPERINEKVEPWLEVVYNQYRVHSGTMSHSSSQSHGNLDSFIIEELKDNVKIDVKGFEKFFEAHIRELDIQAPSDHTISTWLTKDEKEFESYGKRWFTEFSKVAALNSDRFYYGSGDTFLKDAYHKCLRKCDIFLQQRLPDEQHETVMDQLEPDPKMITEKYKFSWKNVLVVGELKYSDHLDMQQGTMIQLSGYVREVFASQPGRRFVHAFTVCGSIARLWLFDRAGVSASAPINISLKEDYKSFRHAMLGYMQMSPWDLGIEEQYTEMKLSLKGKRLELLQILNYTPSIVSRGTLCWRARDLDTGMPCVVKESWRDQKRTPEADFWEYAKQNEVLGCLDVLVSCDTEVACNGVGVGDNIRKYLEFDSAKDPPYRTWRSTSACSNYATLSTIHSGLELGTEAKVVTTQTNHKKRKADPTLPTSSSKRLNTNTVEGRVRSFTVVTNVGQRLETISSPLELLEVLRDAIKCHRSLYERAGILHCDISINNIMKSTEPEGLKGFLIDLDNARYYPKHKSNPTEDTSISLQVHASAMMMMTGTPPFMALELLLKRPVAHTWRHDLESFLYVFIWICMQNPYVLLSSWRGALTSQNAAGIKQNDMSNGFNQNLLDRFQVRFRELKPLARRVRDILFYEKAIDKSEMYLQTPPGEDARNEMYDKMLRAFDDEIAKWMNIKKESSKENCEAEDEWVPV